MAGSSRRRLGTAGNSGKTAKNHGKQEKRAEDGGGSFTRLGGVISRKDRTDNRMPYVLLLAHDGWAAWL